MVNAACPQCRVITKATEDGSAKKVKCRICGCRFKMTERTHIAIDGTSAANGRIAPPKALARLVAAIRRRRGGSHERGSRETLFLSRERRSSPEELPGSVEQLPAIAAHASRFGAPSRFSSSSAVIDIEPAIDESFERLPPIELDLAPAAAASVAEDDLPPIDIDLELPSTPPTDDDGLPVIDEWQTPVVDDEWMDLETVDDACVTTLASSPVLDSDCFTTTAERASLQSACFTTYAKRRMFHGARFMELIKRLLLRCDRFTTVAERQPLQEACSTAVASRLSLVDNR